MRRSNRSGFTLIELMIVVGIIAILVVVLVAVLLNAMSKGEEAKARDFVVNAIPAAILKWQEETKGGDSNSYPLSPNVGDGDGYWQGNAELFEELVTKPKKANGEAYLKPDQYIEGEEGGKPVFLDPWNNYYIYRNYNMKRSVTGRQQVYRGRRYNENTYDIISRGPDGVLYEVEGNNDDIHNGSE